MAKLLNTTVTGTLNVSTTVNATSFVTTTGVNVHGTANAAANTVRVSANGDSTLSAQQLNFINTASLQVLVESGAGAAAGNANVSFSVIGGAQGVQGPQGTTGIQGTQGVQGITGTQGTQGVQGTTGTGTQGVQGTDGTGAQGTQGVQGTTGTGTQGTQGVQGTDGTGAQGTQGVQGTTQARFINYVIDGGGAAIGTGSTEAAQSKGFIEVTSAATVASWNIYANTSGAIAVDVWTGSYADFPTCIMISGTNPPRLAAQQKNTSAGISGWTSGVIAAGNVICFRANSNPAITVDRVTVVLKLT
jgi:hypothetical protein